MGLSCLQPLYLPLSAQGNANLHQPLLYGAQIPSCPGRKPWGHPSTGQDPPPFWGTPRDQTGQGSLHRGFIHNLDVPIPASPPGPSPPSSQGCGPWSQPLAF